MKGKIILTVMLMICAYSGIAGAADYLLVDQSYMANVNSWHNLSYYKLDQEFRPSLSSMNTVELAIYTDEGAMLQVNIRKDSIDGKVVGKSTKLYLPANFMDMASFIFRSPVSLVPGSIYVIELRLLSGTAYVASSFEEDGYPKGYMFIDGINSLTDNSDVIFQTGLVIAQY